MFARLVGSRLVTRLSSVSCTLALLGMIEIQSAAACPMCKLALASGKGDLVSAYMWSILFLIATPFTILGAFSTYCYLQVRRARAAQTKPQAAATASVATPENAAADERTLVGSSTE